MYYFKKLKQEVCSKKLLLVVLPFCLSTCTGQSIPTKGYENLDTLYTDFVRYIKIGGNDLEAYCIKINPDDETVAYMEKNQVSYRGIPNELKKRQISVSSLGEKYFESVASYRERLLSNKQLENLVYVGREEKGEELFDKKLKVYLTETFIIMKSGNDTIRCKLGEMFNYGGRWKTFTEPKLGR